MSFNFVGTSGNNKTGNSRSKDESKVKVQGIVFNGGQPVLKQQSNNEMSARVQFITLSNKLTPLMNLPLGKVNMLVRAFDRNITLNHVPSLEDPKQVEYFLANAANVINNSGSEVQVTIVDGFVKWVNGASVYLEEDTALIFKVLAIVSKSKETGEPSWVNNHFDKPVIRVLLEVVSGLNGQPTVWKGATFVSDILYGVRKIMVEGEPSLTWVVTPQGEQSSGAIQIETFMKTFAPTFLDKLLHGGNVEDVNIDNIVPNIVEALDKDVYASAFVAANYSKAGVPYPKVKWEQLQVVAPEMVQMFPNLESSLPPIDECVYVQPEGVEVKKAEEKQSEEVVQEVTEIESDIDTEAKEWLYQVMDYLAGDTAFSDSGGLTEAGMNAAKTHLTPLKEQNLIPMGELSKGDYEYTNRILSVLSEADTLSEEESQFVKSASEQVTELLLPKSVSEGW